MEYDDKRVGRNVKHIRNANGKTYLDFADDLGISDSLLQKIESGDRRISGEILSRLSEISWISPEDILYGDLGFLERGSLVFPGVFDDAACEEMNSSLLEESSEWMKVVLPVFRDGPDGSADFRDGLEKYDRTVSRFEATAAEIVDAVNCFLRCLKDTGHPDAAANALICFFYLWILMTRLNISFVPEGWNRGLRSFSDCALTAARSIDEKEKEAAERCFFDHYNPLLTGLMRSLRKSASHADFAYYYLALRYSFGVMDGRITKMSSAEHARFGRSMMHSLRMMGNPYAVRISEHFEEDGGA